MKISFGRRWAFAIYCLPCLLLAACTPEQTVPTPSIGTLNVQHYVAVGDTYSSGFSDGGLTRNGQENSFPALLAHVFQRVQSATFTQPLLEAGAGTGYLLFTGIFDATTALPQTQLTLGNAGRGSVANPTACGGSSNILLFNRATTAGTLPQNLGIPGLQLSQAQTANYGNEASATPTVVNGTVSSANPYAASGFNPYFERLLPTADQRSYSTAVRQAARSATFFTFFAGLDDLLPYLRNGARVDGTCSIFPNQGTFANILSRNAQVMLDSLTAGGRPGIIVQLPALNTIPLLHAGIAAPIQAQLQAKYGDTARIYIQNRLAHDTLVAVDNPNNYILATAISSIGQLTSVTIKGVPMMLPYGRDIRNPVKDADAIDYREYSILNGIVTSYNSSLLALATRYKMPALSNTAAGPLLDVSSSVFLQSGTLNISGVQYSADLVRGNIFSLDYYSLTPRGNGLFANAIINAINFAYGASLPTVNVNNLPTTAQ